jgi:hypothetical protein
VVGYGYELRAIDENGQEITHFERNVVMTLPYSEAEVVAAGLAESQLAPVYYSTLLGEWTLVESFVVDTESNWITLQVDHFSRFGKLGFLEEGAELLFLPAIQNTN